MKPKHLEYCIEYLKTGVGAAAYTTVYKQMDKQLAAVSAGKLMKRDDVKAYIKEQQEILSTKGITDVEEILSSIMVIARDPASSRTSKLRALQLAGTHLQMFKTNVNVSGKIENTYSNYSKEELEQMLLEEEDD